MAAPATASSDGTLDISGTLNADGTDTLSNETVTNTGAIEVAALAALTLDNGTTVNNATGAITVDGTLILDDTSSITSGTVTSATTVGY